jgi:predicted RNA binding protein YcfA (HicA-like mRNA interferase family)
MSSSRIKGLYRMTAQERIRTLEERGFLAAEDDC